jgi:hypothetical protein
MKAVQVIRDATRRDPDPVASIAAARVFATDLIERLMLTASPGEHVVTCVTRRLDDGTYLSADLGISRGEHTAEISDDDVQQAFAALLILSRVTGQPVGLVMRSCPGRGRPAAGHECVYRGWVVHRGHAHALKQSSIRSIVGAGSEPRPGRVPHPRSPARRYETAYPLYAEAAE